jgi:hypothetical protein
MTEGNPGLTNPLNRPALHSTTLSKLACFPALPPPSSISCTLLIITASPHSTLSDISSLQGQDLTVRATVSLITIKCSLVEEMIWLYRITESHASVNVHFAFYSFGTLLECQGDMSPGERGGGGGEKRTLFKRRRYIKMKWN